MGIDDLAMDMETLHRLLTKMQVPKDKQNDYAWVLAHLDSELPDHPYTPQAKKLIHLVQERLKG